MPSLSFCTYYFLIVFSLRQVERRVELYKQAGTISDLIVGANSLKRRWRKRGRLNNAEKKLLLPAKNDSSDEEDIDDNVIDDASENEVTNFDNATEDTSSDIDNVTSLVTVRGDNTHSNNGAEGQTPGAVYSMVDKSASLPSHNPTPDCTIKCDAKKGTVTKDGHNFSQQTGKILEQQIPTYYISVDRLPEIQVNMF